MRILLISYFFPPYNTIGAVRTGKMAKYLTKMGHDVHVISANNQPLQRTLLLEIPEDRVTYTKWIDVNKPVQTLLGGRDSIARQGYIPPKGILRKSFKMLGQAYKTLFNFPDGQIGWVPFAIREGSKRIKAWKPDVIYASAMPHSSLLVAKALSMKFGIPWVAEFRDLWVDYQYYHYGQIRRTMETWLERTTLSSAAGYVTVSEPLAETLRSKYDSKPTQVIMNGYDVDDYKAQYVSDQQDVLRIVYTGMVYEGKEDPSPLFQALNMLGDQSRHVRVEFYGRYLESVKVLAMKHGVEHLIQIHDPVTYQQSVQIQCQADILLLLLWNDRNEKGIYSGKLFEYIGARRPILAIGSQENVAADLVREQDVGESLQDAMEVAEVLLGWIEQKLISTITSKPLEGVLHLSREAHAKRLDVFLRSVVYAQEAIIELHGHEVV
ncbi:glycosyltransferase [Paenibacillus sp. N1-5-1-14]|uniref:glycosyltransferase n=1 Tax=Paenibacillus radicibacter TaxID=2972488 RepID=UPI0021594191|nr:glycosyltransferase [Paenibacillus radicibacter]MCR8641082.1 glycosyltransferase [Paenibacillus radicibacter]